MLNLLRSANQFNDEVDEMPVNYQIMNHCIIFKNQIKKILRIAHNWSYYIRTYENSDESFNFSSSPKEKDTSKFNNNDE